MVGLCNNAKAKRKQIAACTDSHPLIPSCPLPRPAAVALPQGVVASIEKLEGRLPPGWASALRAASLRASPMQFHALALAAFASAIAPFGGFFASGFKRGFKIKDFGASIPGHGGMTDRMDCQVVMAAFSYIYYHTYVDRATLSVGGVLAAALKLAPAERLELLEHLANALVGEGTLPHKVAAAIAAHAARGGGG